ncbi:LOW QUALITY PROTEIN: hypothetical protein OSB04_024981 [Centaurea solstitialis]|uniref:Uncharacterized protein n=1 Tax=Centaurea solstitialis TaxID=347529 RepID=A0AA38SNU4_9ASTR|nr:LOW QUALITY PROTEIN: hypothetical protein OSB04_024981 [Centaurea solstitialis]
MILSQYSQVDEVINESMVVPKKKFNFVPLDQLRPYVDNKTLVNVIGVVQHVSPTMSVRRKSDQQITPKTDITLVDETKTSVVVSLWNHHATSAGQELLGMGDNPPIVAIKSLKVGEFQGDIVLVFNYLYLRYVSSFFLGLSLSMLYSNRSGHTTMFDIKIMTLNATKAFIFLITTKIYSSHRYFFHRYDSKGKETISALLCSAASTRLMKTPAPSMFSDRVTLHFITSNPFLGEDNPVYFSTRASMTFINPHQTMSYPACNTCKKKVVESGEKGYWCNRCQHHKKLFTLRYILSAKFFDATSEAWFPLFDEDAETSLGCSADELSKMKSEEEGSKFHLKLQKVKWVPFLFQLSVARPEYNHVSRQKINVIAIAPMDFAANIRLLLNEISAMKSHR